MSTTRHLAEFAYSQGPVDVGQAVETDTAQAVTPRRAHVIGQAVETSVAQPVTPLRVYVIGQAVEQGSVFGVFPTLIGRAAETDTALAVSPAPRRLIEQALEASTVVAVTPVKFTGLPSVGGILSPPGRFDMSIFQGAHFERLVTAWLPTADGLTAIDLTGCTARLQVKPAPESETVLVELSTANGRLFIDAFNRIHVVLTAAETAALESWDTPAFYDLRVTPPSDTPFTVLEGRVVFKRMVTK